jgi:transcriptional regulator with XRE-family HTH domain
MNELAERIKRARKKAGMSQAQLAEACGWKSQSRVGNYEAGTREPTFADITAMAAALSVEESDLLIGHRVSKPEKVAQEQQSLSSADLVRQMLMKHGKNLPVDVRQKISDAVQDTVVVVSNNVITADFSRPGLVGDEIRIAHYDIRGAMGDGQKAADFPEMLKDIRVSQKHLRELGVEYEDYNYLKLVTGWGQSMEPTIKHRDPLIVDISIRDFIGDGIYLYSWDDLLYIKRMQVADADNFEIISDNARHTPKRIRRDDTHILARVLLVWNAHLV